MEFILPEECIIQTLISVVSDNNTLSKNKKNSAFGDALEAYTTISRTHHIKSDYENNSFGCRLGIYIEGTSSRLYLTQANFQVLRVS